MASDCERESSFCDKDFGTNIAQKLCDQKQTAIFCDVIMKVCDHEVFAHSNILAAASPYFTSFFGHDLPRHFSQRAPQVIEIQIDGNEPSRLYVDAVIAVVDYIYTGKMVVKETNVFQISEIARIMQMHNVAQFCERFLAEILTPNAVRDTGTVEHKETGILQSTNRIHDAKTDVAVNTDNYLTCYTYEKTSKNLVSVSTQVLPHLIDVANTQNSLSTRLTSAEENTEFPNITATCNTDQQIAAKCKGKNIALQSITICANTASEPNPDDVRKCGRPQLNETPVTLPPTVLDVTDGDFTNKQSGPNAGVTNASTFDVIEQLLQADGEINHSAVNLVNAPVEKVIKMEDSANTARRRSRRTPKPTAKILNTLKSVRSSTAANEEIAAVQDEPMKVDSTQQLVNSESESNKVASVVEATIVDIDNELLPVQAPGKYTCNLCEFTTSRVREMTRHRQRHLLDANMCYYCDEHLGCREALTKHMALHTGPMPFLCRVCTTQFRNRTQLNLHLPKHSSLKPFMCDICGAGFKWKHALKSHTLVHTQHKEHLCDVCGYATSHRSQLKAHYLIHSGKTFRCTATPDCQFQATKLQNLKYHMLTHTREKPHQCDICGQSFSLVKNMRRHMMMHGTKRPHKCTECVFCTTRYDKLKEHLLKQHNIGPPPEKRVRITDLVTQHMRDPPVSADQPRVADENGDTAEVKPVMPNQMQTLLLHSPQCAETNPQTVQIIIAPQMTSTAHDGQFIAPTAQPLPAITEAENDTETSNTHYENVQFTEVMLPANLVQQVANQVINLYPPS